MPKGARDITVIRKPRVDKLSPASSDPITGLPITNVIILPRQTKEEGQGWITLEGWDIYIMPTSKVQDVGGPRAYIDGDILPTDFIQIDDALWAVDGHVAPFDSGAKRKATQVKVKRASGAPSIPAGPLPLPVAGWDGDDLLDLVNGILDG
jgi:hypothetical protein